MRIEEIDYFLYKLQAIPSNHYLNYNPDMSVKIAIISFPGNNCEVESIRAVQRAGMEAVPFRWNDDTSKIQDCDGYFLIGGFSYEDRGRAGMIPARDPLMDFIREQAAQKKVVIGICNGAQVLVESGLIPYADKLSMSLAHNIVDGKKTGFLCEWIYITHACRPDRCATSNWEGVLHMPMAHGEGRFTTSDPAILKAIQDNGQVVFQYCDKDGAISEDPSVTPNGSTYAIAGLSNIDGNVVALMPHPERSRTCGAYFESIRDWIVRGEHRNTKYTVDASRCDADLGNRSPKEGEIFIDTIITNNEEKSVEQAARRVCSNLNLKQLKYIHNPSESVESILGTISLFNPNKEVAYVRKGDSVYKWDSSTKTVSPDASNILSGDHVFVRRDLPVSQNDDYGVCYVLSNTEAISPELKEVFSNPHSSVLESLNTEY